MRICVCGGRDYINKEKVFSVLDNALSVFDDVSIMNGAAKGADKLSSTWAFERNVPLLEVPADWEKHKRAAGPIRNREMLNLGFDMLIAFPGGRGTADMISITKKANIPVYEVTE